MIEDTLQGFGLKRRESACYLALLELGSSRVGDIVKKSGIPSSKIYEILDKLIKRGFVTYVTKDNVRRFQASDPKAFLDIIDERKREMQEILPQLLLKQRFAARQSVEIFEGQKALFTLFLDLIQDAKPREPYLVFSIDEENKSDQANLFFKNLAVRRKEKGLDVRLLKHVRLHAKERHSKLKMRYTSFNLPQGLTIFRDRIILLSWVESPVAIRIQSAVFAGQWRDFFLDLWKSAKA